MRANSAGMPFNPKLFVMAAYFDPEKHPSITFPGGATIEVDVPLALIAIRLEVAPGAESAQFVASPLGWLDPAENLIEKPPNLMVLPTTHRDFAILDVNTAPREPHLLLHRGGQLRGEGLHLARSGDPQ